MRDIAILEFVTLDGVMQSPTRPDEDTSGGFAQGGWAAGFMEGVMPQVIAEAMTQPYDLLFGRTTYDLFAEHWPNESDDNPVARILNRARKYVVTNSPKDDYTWPNTTDCLRRHRVRNRPPEEGRWPAAADSWQLQTGPHADEAWVSR